MLPKAAIDGIAGWATGSDGGVEGVGVAGSVCSEPALTGQSSDAGLSPVFKSCE